MGIKIYTPIKRIINIVDNLSPVNFGIWNAAIAQSEILEKKYGIQSECWYPYNKNNSALPVGIIGRELHNLSKKEVKKLIESEKLKPHETLVITHGAWRFPTRFGNEFAKRGFIWWYVPHGMLEPWGMKEKRLKKLIYFNLIEKRLVRRAFLIRAVGKPELINLKRLFSKLVKLIPNGIPVKVKSPEKTFDGPKRFLFMSRLHHKKSIVPLINAWYASELCQNPFFELLIAGPDDGELSQIKNILSQHKGGNVKYIGAVYGLEKEDVLRSSHFFVLPSQSEGFPTSVLEAMQYGVIPVISDGCNFPEAFQKGLAIRTTCDEEGIKKTLEETILLSKKELKSRSLRIQYFVGNNYSMEVIGKKIFESLL
jgi:glycosyltransferase involved in cell wall biosynthesis